MRQATLRLLEGTLLTGVLLRALAAQTDWAFYGKDPGGARYSTLSQINAKNVATLRPVWTYDSSETSLSFESTPLVIGNVMHFSTPHERVVALLAKLPHRLKLRPLGALSY